MTQVDDELWSAIADPSRRRVLDLLVRGGAASASALADEVPFTRQAVMKHLAVLEDAGLVTRHREGREVRFAVDPHRLDEATRAMMQLAGEWDRRLQSIKRIAEAAHRNAQGRDM
jgi:ArsR family transcriptional regulator, cadmium/lead-responsive transcriptional repressor